MLVRYVLSFVYSFNFMFSTGFLSLIVIDFLLYESWKHGDRETFLDLNNMLQRCDCWTVYTPTLLFFEKKTFPMSFLVVKKSMSSLSRLVSQKKKSTYKNKVGVKKKKVSAMWGCFYNSFRPCNGV